MLFSMILPIVLLVTRYYCVPFAKFLPSPYGFSPSNRGHIFLQQVILPWAVYWPRVVSNRNSGIPHANKKTTYGMKNTPEEKERVELFSGSRLHFTPQQAVRLPWTSDLTTHSVNGNTFSTDLYVIMICEYQLLYK